jgi:hypothetical protein
MRRRDDAREAAQERTDPLTGARYFVRVPESAGPSARPASGYVDPIAEEFRSRDIAYDRREIADFEAVVQERYARPAAERRGPRPPPPKGLWDAAGAGAGDDGDDGPFRDMTPAMRSLLRRRLAVREVVAALGPQPPRARSVRELMRACGAFLLLPEGEARDDPGAETYAMMEDPPPPARELREEKFCADDDSALEAVVQERLRVLVRYDPFRYKFSWA